ncbi:CLUMA_CG017049, isoform A [Clunio marinus]|uniref:Polypeptide N-acetylgalactosaminyltransferase n=1 Tax=Clunio marinus TaxID=568069 RepID=A0A1J1IUZ2_9DIPT|nr:CLUMA_CG017049, isoform A [Clunio marinus]
MLKKRRVARFRTKFSFRRNYDYFIAFIVILFITFIATYKTIEFNNSPLSIKRNFIYIEPINSFFRRIHNLDNAKVDWHDYDFIEVESKRVGPGEHGMGIDEVKPYEEALNKKLFDENGYNGLISDKISVNRSLKDLRHPNCKELKYLQELPTVSVVIPFYNDHLSVLLRTVHSVINRSPKKLLREIILVNDRSTKEFLYEPLKTYIKENFPPDKVKLLELPKRSGLIWARLAGARSARGDVLIFLDSHTEANTNWLPPLLEPIAEDYRVCVCPFIDVIEFKTFEYVIQDEGSRGIFDWYFNYRKLDLKKYHQNAPTDLFESPVMAGGLFAISTKFFWEIGGYDSGLDIWGGEQYELSFKIWLCGGKMYDAPCSRVGHVYRGGMPFADDRKGIDFLTINYKRVAEVWMDDYAKYIYARSPERFNKVDPGDLSYQYSIKERLQCKPFSYFIDRVAPDMLEFYPLVDPPPFAYGTIQSVMNPNLCIDSYGRDDTSQLGFFYCATDKMNPQHSQFFTLRHFRDIELRGTMFCFDQNEFGMLVTGICHHAQGNQYFRYNPHTQQIIHGSIRRNECIDSDIDRMEVDAIFLSKCDENSPTQKWNWGFVNKTAIENWKSYGTEIIDKNEIEALETLESSEISI